MIFGVICAVKIKTAISQFICKQICRRWFFVCGDFLSAMILGQADFVGDDIYCSTDRLFHRWSNCKRRLYQKMTFSSLSLNVADDSPLASYSILICIVRYKNTPIDTKIKVIWMMHQKIHFSRGMFLRGKAKDTAWSIIHVKSNDLEFVQNKWLNV